MAQEKSNEFYETPDEIMAVVRIKAAAYKDGYLAGRRSMREAAAAACSQIIVERNAYMLSPQGCEACRDAISRADTHSLRTAMSARDHNGRCGNCRFAKWPEEREAIKAEGKYPLAQCTFHGWARLAQPSPHYR